MTAPQHPNYDPLMTSGQAAQYLGIHVETLRKMTRLRELDCVRKRQAKGSDVHYRLSALNKWVNAHTVRAAKGVA